MEKGRGKRTDTSIPDKVFTRKEYIEREAVLKWIDFVSDGYSYLETGTEFAKRDINAIPAADVAPVRHGKWVKATGMMPPEYCGLHICSECGHYAGRKPPYGGREMLSNYCHNCGAKMDGDGDGV